MMRKIIVLVAFAALGILGARLAVAAQTVRAEGRYVSMSLTGLAPFQAVKADGDVRVEIRQMDNPTVTLSGRTNLVDLADVRVEDNTLVVRYKRPIYVREKERLNVSVLMPQITALAAHQHSEINVYGAVNATDLSLSAADKGEIDMDSVTAKTVRMQASGHAEIDVERVQTSLLEATAADKATIDLSGYAENATLVNKSTKDLEADNLRINQAHVAVHGAGDVEVFAVKTLKASAHGSGEIKYHGAPVLTREGNFKKIKPMFD